MPQLVTGYEPIFTTAFNIMNKQIFLAGFLCVFSLSQSTFHEENRDTVRRILAKNNFPPKLTEEIIKKVYSSARRNNSNNLSYPFINQTTLITHPEPLDQSAIRVANESTHLSATENSVLEPAANSIVAQQPKRFVGMIYISGLTEQLSKAICRVTPNLTIAPRPIAKVGEIFTDMKEKLSPDQQSLVVCRVRCKTCGRFYIGETTWCLCDRIKTHESDVRNMTKNPKKTALVKHVFDTGPLHHEFDFNNKEVLKKVRKKGVLKIHEANQIILHGNDTVNFKSDAAHITPVFYNLIKNNSKLPIVNPQQPTSLVRTLQTADVLTGDTPNVTTNNNSRNTMFSQASLCITGLGGNVKTKQN